MSSPLRLDGYAVAADAVRLSDGVTPLGHYPVLADEVSDDVGNIAYSYLDVRRYWVDGDVTWDAAVTRARAVIAAQPSTGSYRRLYFAPGQYLLRETHDIATADTVLEGAGIAQTVIDYRPTASDTMTAAECAMVPYLDAGAVLQSDRLYRITDETMRPWVRDEVVIYDGGVEVDPVADPYELLPTTGEVHFLNSTPRSITVTGRFFLPLFRWRNGLSTSLLTANHGGRFDSSHLIYGGGLANLTITCSEYTRAKIVSEFCDVSRPFLKNVLIRIDASGGGYDTTTKSIAVVTRGRDMMRTNGVELRAYLPYLMGYNPNYATLCADHYLIEDAYLVAYNSGGYLMEIEDRAVLSNTTLRQIVSALGGGCFRWRDTRISASTVDDPIVQYLSNNVSVEGCRSEQATPDSPEWFWDSSAPLWMFTIDNAYGAHESQGVRLRNCIAANLRYFVANFGTFEATAPEPGVGNVGDPFVDYAPRAGSRSQTITITALSATRFAVVGSVDGELPHATADMLYYTGAIVLYIAAGATPCVAGDTWTLETTTVPSIALDVDDCFSITLNGCRFVEGSALELNGTMMVSQESARIEGNSPVGHWALIAPISSSQELQSTNHRLVTPTILGGFKMAGVQAIHPTATLATSVAFGTGVLGPEATTNISDQYYRITNRTLARWAEDTIRVYIGGVLADPTGADPFTLQHATGYVIFASADAGRGVVTVDGEYFPPNDIIFRDLQDGFTTAGVTNDGTLYAGERVRAPSLVGTGKTHTLGLVETVQTALTILGAGSYNRGIFLRTGIIDLITNAVVSTTPNRGFFGLSASPETGVNNAGSEPLEVAYKDNGDVAGTGTMSRHTGKKTYSGSLEAEDVKARGLLIGVSAVDGAAASTAKTGGTATLVAGTVTVATTKATTNCLVHLTRKTAGGTIGNLTWTRVADTSITITSDSATDTSVVGWTISEVQL